MHIAEGIDDRNRSILGQFSDVTMGENSSQDDGIESSNKKKYVRAYEIRNCVITYERMNGRRWPNSPTQDRGSVAHGFVNAQLYIGRAEEEGMPSQ